MRRGWQLQSLQSKHGDVKVPCGPRAASEAQLQSIAALQKPRRVILDKQTRQQPVKGYLTL